MTRFRFWQQWLLWVSGSMVVFSVILALFTPSVVLPVYHTAVNHVIWGGPDLPESSRVLHGFLFGVLGATMASQALLQAFIAAGPFARKEPWSWWAITLGMAIWFPLDTALSLAWGVWPNAVFNLLALLAIALPLALTAGDFRRQGPSSATHLPTPAEFGS